MISLPEWWKAIKKRKDCFHHDHKTGQSWIKSQLINIGTGKMFWCAVCGRTWFV